MRKVKVGLVGLGEIAQIVHLPILQEYSDQFEIAALCDISQELIRPTFTDAYTMELLHFYPT